MSQKTKRRQFTAGYKLRILKEADRCGQPGQIAALLRREGLYSSHLSRWRRQRAQGQLQGLAARKRGPKPTADRQLQKEAARLRREKERLQARLQQAETIIEAQKKLAQQLGLAPGETDENETA